MPAARVVLRIAARAERRLVPSWYCVAQESVEIDSVGFVELVHRGFNVVVAYLVLMLNRILTRSDCVAPSVAAQLRHD